MEHGFKIPVLDHGHVIYDGHFGSDADICRAARISYAGREKETTPEGDRKLINYLFKNKHTSPFEMGKIRLVIKMPIFVARQYIRHRMQNCIAGDSMIEFDLPAGQKRGRRIYKLKISDICAKWNSNQKSRIEKMKIRCVDEERGFVMHGRIEDCWRSGVKEVYEITLDNGRSIRATKDHRLLTNHGWLQVQQILNGSHVKIATVGQKPSRAERFETGFSMAEMSDEKWIPIIDWPGYDVSNLGRVRSWRNTRGRTLNYPVIKKQTTTKSGHKVVSLSGDGRSKAFHVHRLVLESFVGRAAEGFECGHRDGNGFNNNLNNIRWITKLENQSEKTAAGNTPKLGLVFVPVKSIIPSGQVETYDIRVSDPHHNYCANGIVVHNCNEVSARYTELPEEFYIPEKWRYQDTKNKQGSGGSFQPAIMIGDIAAPATAVVSAFCEQAYELYLKLIAAGVAREMARMVLPLNIYTEMVVCWDMKNLLHFITLREDAHAQSEIQEYGRAIKSICVELFPMVMKAYARYQFKTIDTEESK